MAVTRARFEARGKTKDEIYASLEEELRAFSWRHRGPKAWAAEQVIQHAKDGFWGYLIVTEKEAQHGSA